MILALKTVTYAIPDPETHLSFVSYTFWRFYLIWPMGALLFLEASLSMCKAEFQRIARTEKKAFLSDQRKEIEGNNRLRKTRDLFKKIRDTKGTFHAKMGSVKDRNGMDLTEAEDIKKRWQEYTELYKKDLHNPDNHDGMITHLEKDILEYEVKTALGSITMNKASGGDGIPVEQF